MVLSAGVQQTNKENFGCIWQNFRCVVFLYHGTRAHHAALTSAMQACAGTVSTDADAGAFWLDEAQAAVLANEDGPEASPLFMGGVLRKHP